MKALIPLLTKEENDLDFLEEAVGKAKEVVLLGIVDDESLAKGQFGFAANEIRHSNAFLEEVKAILEKQGKVVKDISEWGDTARKIGNIAKLNQVNKVCMKKVNNKFFRDLEEALRKDLKKEKIHLEIIG
jgi:hypothetical protein